MKKVIGLVLLVLAGTVAAQSSHYRSGYVTRNGTYVAPSYATNPNNTLLDNYSTKGNVNPYTGKIGTVEPYRIEPIRTPQLRSPSNTLLRQRGLSLLDNDD